MHLTMENLMSCIFRVENQGRPMPPMMRTMTKSGYGSSKTIIHLPD